MKVVVVGAGAAGLMAAAEANKNGANVVVLEKNPRPARKVMITGKGRCNLTNDCSFNDFLENIPRNHKFLYSCLRSFGPRDIMSSVESAGVPVKVERGNRVFPVSDKAVDIVDVLYKMAHGCRFRFNCAVTGVAIEDAQVKGVYVDKEFISADCVIIATGGMSYSKTGSTGDGYRFAKLAGHCVTELVPSLIPLEIESKDCKDLMGLSLKNVTLSLIEDGKTVYSELGEMMFTHFGISGPLVLSASAHINKPQNCTVSIDLKPALTIEQLDLRLRRDFDKYINKELKNGLDELLPKRLIPYIIKAAGLSPNTKINQITKQERAQLIAALKGYSLKVSGYRPIEEAIITRGGVEVGEINPKTMESKLCKGLYFVGEILDVDGYTGGFNLQIAFSTGYAAGNNLRMN